MAKKSTKAKKEEQCFKLDDDDMLVLNLSINNRLFNENKEKEESLTVLNVVSKKIKSKSTCFNDTEVKEIIDSLDKSKEIFRVDLEPIKKKLKKV